MTDTEPDEAADSAGDAVGEGDDGNEEVAGPLQPARVKASAESRNILMVQRNLALPRT